MRRNCAFQYVFTFILLGTLVSLLKTQLVDEEPFSEEECKELGYVKASLKCPSCHLMSQFNLEQIITDCLRCCSPEKKEAHERYPSAELEVCECNLYRFQQIAAFVKGDMKDEWGSKLKIRHVRGVLPTIVLKSADGQTQKSLNVEKWDTDTLREFLNDWLE